MSFVVGLTGGIGSGKTTVSDTFAELGIHVIDADIIARQVVEPESEGLEQIIGAFGKACLLDNGELNRRALREQVFNNPEQLKQLESITHPLIQAAILNALQCTSSAYTLLVIPLLLESERWLSIVNRVLVVDVSEKTQIARVRKRDQVTDEHINKIIEAQMERNIRRSKADDILMNDGSLEQLKERVHALHEHYLQLAKKH